MLSGWACFPLESSSRRPCGRGTRNDSGARVSGEFVNGLEVQQEVSVLGACR